MSLLVALGDSGKVFDSTSGTSWTAATSNPYTGFSLRALTWSPDLGLFVMAGTIGALATSPDGSTWSVQTSGFGSGSSGLIYTAAWSPSLGLFVIAGANAKIATSPDGVTWTLQTSGISTSVQFRGATWAPALGLFVITGDSGVVVTSPDGINWTQRTSASGAFGSNFISDVAWAPSLGTLVAVGNGGTIAYSTDGINWGTVASGLGASLFGVAWSPSLGLFVATGSAGVLYTSADGSTWFSRTSGFGISAVRTAAWSPSLGLFIIGGQSGKMATSPNGVTWTSRTSGFGTDDIYRIVDAAAPTYLRTGTVSAAPSLTATAVVAYARTATLAAAPALSAAALPALVRTANLAAAPVLSAVAFVDDGTRSGTVTAAPILTATAVAILARTGTVTAAPALSATQIYRTSALRNGTVQALAGLSAVGLISKQTRTGTLTAAAGLSATSYAEVYVAPGPPLVGKVDLRLKAYAPNGAAQGDLPAPQGYQAAMPLNDVPGLSGTYGVMAPRSSLLGTALEIALEITTDGGASWREPPDCRFLYLTDGRDPVRQNADEFAFEAKGYVWRLSKARVLASGALNADGRREFTGTAGAMLQTLWSEATGRGALSGMTLQGGGTTDASGAAWGATFTRAYDVGQDYLSVLLDLAASGYLDFRTEARTLRLFKPDASLAADRTITPEQITIQPNQVTEQPFRRTWEGLADSITVMGDEGKSVEVNNPSALKPWGRWEDFVTQGGVQDAGTLTAIGQRYQTLTSDQRLELTTGLALGVGQTPLVDFSVGDYVWSQPASGTKTRYRVRQATLVKGDDKTVQGNVVLNDRFQEADIRTRRAIDAIVSGASVDGSSGPPPTPPGADILQPAQASTPTGSSSVYTDAAGTAWAQVSLDWPDVTTNLDGTPLTDLDHYDVQAKKGTGAWQIILQTAESRATSSPYVPGDVWTFRVRAVDTSNNYGPWSTTLTLTMQADTTGPVQPSLPTVTERLGTASVAWDGKAFNGAAMDADFARVDIHVSTTSGFTPSAATLRSNLVQAGTAIVAPLTYSTTVYVKLVPYDTSGNAGTPSAQATLTVNPLVDVSNFPDSAVNDLYVRTAHFLQLDADQVTTNSAAIGFLNSGYIIGAVIQATEFWSNATPTSGGFRIRDADGINAWANGGALKFSVNRTTGLLYAEDADVRGTIRSGAPGGARVELSPTDSALAVYKSGGTLMGRLWAFNFGSDVLALVNPSNQGYMMTSTGIGFINAPTLQVSSDVQISGTLGGVAGTNPISMTTGFTMNGKNIAMGGGALNMAAGAVNSLGTLNFDAWGTVTRGAADSGGTGFRYLRVVN